MQFEKLKKEIESKFSDTKEVEGVFVPVRFNSIFSHDIIIKEQLEKGLLASELHKKPKEKAEPDNRFMSKRMREIMFLPVVK